MRTKLYPFIREFTLFILSLTACASARANIVFDNFTQPSNGPTVGTSVGASIIMGDSPISVNYIVFPQLFGTTNDYVPGETFSIDLRNADGTVGLPIYSDFTLSNDATSGQTDVFPITPMLLLPNSGYWFIASAPSTTVWQYTTSSSFTALPGVALPVNDVAYKVNNGTTTYFSDGPQLLYLDGTAVVVPEPSSFCLFAAAGAAIFLCMRRKRGAPAL